ncbi:MAG: YjcQ family protein [Sporomusaceae bacterium]|nr:YjcQ family protein [Sporomusaceae bacterium]
MSTKEKVLMAIYREYEKGNRDMRRTVRHDELKLEAAAFNRDIQLLQYEGLIRGAVLVRDRNKTDPDQVILNQVAVTNYGLHYLRSLL